ncbi:MAG: DUF488 family protein [Gammaproteobacteria bacterium]|nr:DUF488 family protein [Gammaproteobacteria bacterium]
MRISVKRIYAKATSTDGKRILVDRLWPRGIKKEGASIDFWAKDIAPSNALRKWYRHDHDKWPEFKRKYFAELNENGRAVEELLSHLQSGTNTLLFSSKEPRLNNACALKEYLESL